MMRRLALLLALSATIAATAQRTTRMPGPTGIDVERLRGGVDTSVDAEQLSLAEARVLRNAFAARQGYLFTYSDLRALFLRTSWYRQRMQDHWQREQQRGREIPVSYSKDDLAFIRQLKMREAKLSGDNYHGQQPNLQNLINPWMLTDFTSQQQQQLCRDGFLLTAGQQRPVADIYRSNRQEGIPTLITVDHYLQLLGQYYNRLTEEVRRVGLSDNARELGTQLQQEMRRYAKRYAKCKPLVQAAAQNVVWLEQQPTVGQMLNAHLQSATEEHLRQDVLLAYAIGSQPDLRQAYEQMGRLSEQFEGTASVITLLHLYEAVRRTELPIDKLMKNRRRLQELHQVMVQTMQQPTDEDGDDWGISLYAQRTKALRRLAEAQTDYPQFMRSSAWQQRAKTAAQNAMQAPPFAGTLPRQAMIEATPRGTLTPPVHRYYVEPNTRFYRAAIRLLNTIQQTLTDQRISSPQTDELNRTLRRYTQQLLQMSEKQLDGERLTTQEQRQLEALAMTLADAVVQPATEVYVLAEMDGYLWLMRGAQWTAAKP